MLRNQNITNMAIPFPKALDTLIECFCESLMVEFCSHCFPLFDEKLETWYDLPDCRLVLLRKGLLDV
jgi:hypothetical protein